MEGFLDSTVFDLELPRSAAFAARYDFWVELLVLEIDQDDVSEAQIDIIANCVKQGARVEDALYYMSGKQFIIKSLSRHSKGILVLADRFKESIGQATNGELTISCGAISYWAGLKMPFEEVKDFLFSELALAQQNGGHQMQYQTIDVASPICQKVIDID